MSKGYFWSLTVLTTALLAVLGGACAQRATPDVEPAAESQVAEGTATAADEIDPALICYRQTAEIPTGFREVRALAVGADRVYVGGDKAIHVFDRQGKQINHIALQAEPRCLAVSKLEEATTERIYVGAEEHIEVWGTDGKRLAVWNKPAKRAWFTSIAATGEDVFVADFRNRIVWHYDTDGKLKGRIGAADAKRNIPGLHATTPYLDLAVGDDSLLYVVNPRYLRIEVYTPSGDLERHWGKGSSELADFYGCCNPTHIAILPGRRFVTAEKGIPRIKVYSPEGKFECVVAGPRQFKSQTTNPIADLATDHQGRVLALDSSTSVRVYEKVNQKP